MEKTITMPLAEYEAMKEQMEILREHARPDVVYVVVDQFGMMKMREYGTSGMIQDLMRERNQFKDLCDRMLKDIQENVPEKFIKKMNTVHW